MRIAALFAGIGGMEKGLHEAGHETILTCEIWDPAVAVLGAQFPLVANYPDVSSLKSLPAKTELLTAGFPCQDLSQAGMTAGIGGRRSGLVDHVFRLLDQRKVPVVVLENVSFMLSLDQGAAMDRLTKAFEERGYRWAYRIVNSLAFLPQRRERVFFVASRCDLDPSTVLFVDEAWPKPIKTSLDVHAHGFYWTEGTRGLGWAPNAVPTLKNGSTVGIPSPPAILMPDGRVIKPDIRDAERLQGFPADWTASAPERYRWSLVGNSVSVPVAAWLGKRLRKPGSYAIERDRHWPIKQRSFPRAARYDGTARHAVEISDFPAYRKREPLHEFLRHPGTPLSVRGTAGFLSRAEASSLRFVPGFLDAVRAHLEYMRAAETSTLRFVKPKARKSKVPALIAAE
ncbi:MAG: DNA (cytosine-5-)-methyltransferase [Hyphomicrobiaceae bacterium]|nr:DNA (cytosine-5-)-methyltransferase [Hyphomicrobiaceae bacterium]